MKLLRKNIAFILIIFEIFLSTIAFSAHKDSITQKTSVASEKILHLTTLWNYSSNSASLQFFDIQQKIGKVQIEFQQENGDFHPFQKAEKIIKPGFFTNGYIALNNWKFYGDFNYFNRTDKGIKFTDVLEPYSDNPYTLGDKVGGTYHKEYFKMRGRGAWQANNLISLGFDIKYKTAIGARRKDPRPSNEITEFNVTPGIILNLEKIKFGAHFHYQTGKEDIALETVTDSTYDFYHFRGLGVFTTSTEMDNRSSETELTGGGLLFNVNGNNISNLSELTFSRKTINIKRGMSFPLQVVLLENFNTSFNSGFSFATSAKKVNKLSLGFNDKRIYGHEPVVEPRLEQVNYQWNTIAKYTLYWHKQQNYEVNYAFYKLKNANHFNWGTQFSAKIVNSETTYYFVPEFNRQKLHYFSINALAEKEIRIKNSDLILQAESGFRKGFNSTLNLVSDEVLLESVNRKFVQHDFDYFNKNMFFVGGNITIGKYVKIEPSIMQLYFSTSYKIFGSKLYETSKRNQFSITIGMNF